MTSFRRRRGKKRKNLPICRLLFSATPLASGLRNRGSSLRSRLALGLDFRVTVSHRRRSVYADAERSLKPTDDRLRSKDGNNSGELRHGRRPHHDDDLVLGHAERLHVLADDGQDLLDRLLI